MLRNRGKTLESNGVPHSHKDSPERPKRAKSSDWDRVLMAGLLSFLASSQNAPLQIIFWPYLSELDHWGAFWFYGLLLSMSRLGFAVSSVGFAKCVTFRTFLLTGRVLSAVACVSLLFVEFLRNDGSFRLLFIIAYGFLAAANSTCSSLPKYSYLSVVEKHEQLAKYAVSLGFGLGKVFGPVITVAFSPLGYLSVPLSSFSNKLPVNMYTLSIWSCLAISLFSILLIICKFEDYERGTARRARTRDFLRDGFAIFRSTKISCYHVYHVMCGCVVKIATELNAATLMTFTAPVFTALFRLNSATTVLLVSICVIFSSGLSIGVAKLLDSGCWNRSRVVFHLLVSIATISAISVLNIAIMFLTSDSCISTASSTSTSECRLDQTMLVVLYMSVYIVMMGIVLPFVRREGDKLYCLNGTANQPLLVGCVTVSREIATIIGPLYSVVITYYSPPYLWMVNGCVSLFVVVFLLPHFFIHCKFLNTPLQKFSTE